MKRTRTAHEKFVDKLNKRIQRVEKTFGKDAVYQNMMESIQSIEGVQITKSGLISTKNSKLVLQTLEANINTVKNIKDLAFERMYEGSDTKRSEVSNDELVNLANRYALEDATYNATLNTFYNNRPSDYNSVKAVDFTDIQKKLKHPGRKLSEDEIIENTNMIRKFLEG